MLVFYGEKHKQRKMIKIFNLLKIISQTRQILDLVGFILSKEYENYYKKEKILLKTVKLSIDIVSLA